MLADEIFTPDSSRYWPAADYRVGVVQASFDKQFVRNWLTGPDSGWDRSGSQPPPPLPEGIIDATRARYIEAYERISGLSFGDWIGPGMSGAGDDEQSSAIENGQEERRP